MLAGLREGYYTDRFRWGMDLIYSSIAKSAIALLLVLAIAVGILRARAYSPGDVEPARVQCSQDALPWTTASPLKVMSYNVQYMASKNYIFFYDIDLDDQERVDAVAEAGKSIASRPSEEHVLWTLDEVARLIMKEDPDVLMLQEVNGAKDSRTHNQDQVGELLRRLPADLYACRSDAPYWQAEFVFHPDVLGPVDMRLSTLSKHRMTQSVRHQLPRRPRNFLIAPFHLQRALLESHIATDQGHALALINTHFEAWGAGTGIMERQIARTEELLQSLDRRGIPWVFGGDLNLLPPDGNRQRTRILAARTGTYDEDPPIASLYQKYRGIPSLADLASPDPKAWYTHFPNDPTVDGPDRTIDYLFYSDRLSLQDGYIIQQEAWPLSDHLPVVGVFTVGR